MSISVMVTDRHDDRADYEAFGGRKGSKDAEPLAQRTRAVSLYPTTHSLPLSEIFNQRSKKEVALEREALRGVMSARCHRN